MRIVKGGIHNDPLLFGVLRFVAFRVYEFIRFRLVWPILVTDRHKEGVCGGTLPEAGPELHGWDGLRPARAENAPDL